MAFTRNFFATLAVTTALASPVFAEETTLDTVVATVSDIQITVGHMVAIKQQLPEQYRSLPDDQLFPGILDQLIQQTLLANSIDQDPNWMAVAMENQRRNVLSNHVIDQTRNSAVTEDAVRAAYDITYAGQPTGFEWDASHILVETEDAALALVEQINGGADFAELAKEHSTGPSGANGGSLGWFGKGQMVPEFELAVSRLDLGDVSGPVRTQFGFHVIKLNDVRPTMPPSLEEVRPEIERQLRQAAVEAKMADLMSSSNIGRTEGIDPSVLSTLSFE